MKRLRQKGAVAMRKHLPLIVLSLLVLFLSVSCKQEPATYTITYRANGGSDAPAADTKVPGLDYTIAGVGTMARTGGYLFTGWNTQADGTGTNYAVGATYATDEPLTLYAKWTQYVKFSSSETFTLKVYDVAKHWNGTLQYSTDAISWTEWNGTEISSSTGTNLYLRGSDNKVITGSSNSSYRWVLTPAGGASISCTGNIETLLDHATVAAGTHPTMGNYCYAYLFRDCTSLTTAPALPSTTLADGCYGRMFYGCTSLATVPVLPATTLAYICYESMFRGCTSLTTAPALPAETLANSCYKYMFSGCTNVSVNSPPIQRKGLLPHTCWYGGNDEQNKQAV